MKLQLLGSTVAALLLLTGCDTNSSDKNSTQNVVQTTQDSSSVKLSIPKVGTTYPMDNIAMTLATATFTNGFELNATWGIGSGAYQAENENEVYVITDRGVNIKCADSLEITGTQICEKGKIFPFPTFTPAIMRLALDEANNEVTLKEVIELKDRNGKRISGVSNPLSNFSEIAYDVDGNEMQKDPNGLDVEAVIKMRDGTFWLSEEYAPSILHVKADGTIIKRFVPAGLESELLDAGVTYDVEGSLPAILSKRHANRGIESIAKSVDEKTLYFTIQSPLDNPDYGTSRNVRLLAVKADDVSSYDEYLYQIDLPETFNKDNETKVRNQKDVKISEIITVEDGTLLVSERISQSNKFYRIDLSKEIPLDKKYDDEATTPNLEAETSLTPVAKTKVFDTDFVEGMPNKLEGIADLGNNKFFVINDNDFGIAGDATVGRIVTIDLDAKIDKKQTQGRVLFFDTDGNFEKEVKAGILPDMLKFTHDGKKVLVANEGEVSGNEDLEKPLYDAYGSVSIIDTTTYEVTHLDFKSITEAPVGSKIRKDAEVARDFEPEYIAINEDDTTAWVSLQESNAIAKIDLSDNSMSVFGLGFKDLSLNENAMDYKKDGVVNIETLPHGVYGMYQPDTITTYRVGSKDYIVTANEGDDRDDYYAEATKASKLSHEGIGDVGDVRVNPDLGDADGDGEYEALYTYGARSFSIFDADGTLVYDSGNDFETKVAELFPKHFNTRPKKGKWYESDERSEKKGVEPESLTLAVIDNKTYAYIGLEKQGGFFTYDISDPLHVTQVAYTNDINYSRSFDYKTEVTPSDIDDMAPEGSVTFVQENKNYLSIANEVSGSVSIYEIENDGVATKVGTYRTGIYYESAAEIVDYDSVSKRLFVTSSATNSVMILDVSNPSSITKVKDIELSIYGSGVNSVSVHNGKIAIAVERSE